MRDEHSAYPEFVVFPSCTQRPCGAPPEGSAELAGEAAAGADAATGRLDAAAMAPAITLRHAGASSPHSPGRSASLVHRVALTTNRVSAHSEIDDWGCTDGARCRVGRRFELYPPQRTRIDHLPPDAPLYRGRGEVATQGLSCQGGISVFESSIYACRNRQGQVRSFTSWSSHALWCAPPPAILSL